MGLIHLDTCIVIYAFENDPVFGERAQTAMQHVSGNRFAVSPL